MSPFSPAGLPVTSGVDWLRRRLVAGKLAPASIPRRSVAALSAAARAWAALPLPLACRARAASPSYHAYASRVGAGGMSGDGYHTVAVRDPVDTPTFPVPSCYPCYLRRVAFRLLEPSYRPYAPPSRLHRRRSGCAWGKWALAQQGTRTVQRHSRTLEGACGMRILAPRCDFNSRTLLQRAVGKIL